MFHCQTSGWSVVLPWQFPVWNCSMEMSEQSVPSETASGAVHSRKQLLCWFSWQVIARSYALEWSWYSCCVFIVKYCSKHSLSVEVFRWSFLVFMRDLSCNKERVNKGWKRSLSLQIKQTGMQSRHRSTVSFHFVLLFLQIQMCVCIYLSSFVVLPDLLY